MAEEKTLVKVNKKHGGKEFSSFFRFVGLVKPVRKFNNDTGGWEEQPIFQETITRTQKPRRILQFNVETAPSNELKVEFSAMEQEYVFAYSSTHKKTAKIKWENRFDKSRWKDENEQVTIDNTYHLITSDWDKILELAEKVDDKKINEGLWVEVTGVYEPNEFPDSDGNNRIVFKRIINNIRPIVNGKVLGDDGKERPIKINGNEINYITDFNSPDFVEVNYFLMQIGIRSTYQDENTKDTKVNAVYLTYGKERSTPYDIELTVPYREPSEGKKALADAFSTLQYGDFIEVTGTDNNRVEFAEIEVDENFDPDDPFNDAEGKTVRKRRVVSGDKKGLEVLGFVAGTRMKNFLTEEEITKENNNSENPFANNNQEYDPFSDNSKPLDLSEDDLSF
jgi:hypothetical protein